MHFIRALRFQLGLLAITVMMIVGGVYVSRIPEHQARQGQWVGHTREVMDQLDVLSLHIAQAQPVGANALAAARIGGDLKYLQELTADNVVQQERITTLHKMVAKIDSAPNSSAKTAARKDLDAIITTMLDEERGLLKMRETAWEDAVAHTKRTILLGILGLYGTICFVYYLLSREAERRRVQAVIIQQEAARLSLIVDVQHAISQHRLDLTETMQIINDNVLKLIAADGSIIEIMEGEEMIYASASGSGSPHVGLRINMNGSLSGSAVRENRMMICEDVETDKRVDKVACRRVGVRSMVVVPLQRKGVAVGVLKVLSSLPNAFVKSDVDTLELLTVVIAATMNDATAIESIRTINQSLTEEKHELQFANAQLQNLATTDGLTKLKNHRFFREQLTSEFSRAKRYGTPFSLVLIDVDHFKQFNDTFGHPAGDEVLRKVGAKLKELARTTDTVARHGGEEFAMILPETGSAGAFIIAERVCKAIADVAWDLRAVTISVGVASYTTEMSNDSVLLDASDKALYSAKKSGRNRVSQAA